MSRKAFGLTVVLLIALVVRGYGAAAFPFEQDELYTIEEATNLFDTRLLPGIQARPLFFLIEHPLVTNLPQTELVLRLLALVFGMAGVWVTWLLARQILSERASMFAMLIAALSPWHMYASAFTRYYSLIYLLAALVYWLLPKALDKDTPRAYLLAMIPLLLGAWSHPSFVFPIAGAILAAVLLPPVRGNSAGTLSAPPQSSGIKIHWPTRNGWLFLWLPFLGISAAVWGIIQAIHGSAAVDNGGDRGLLATLRLLPAMVDWMTPTIFIAGAVGALLLASSSNLERRRFGYMTLAGVIVMFVALFGLAFITSIYADYGMAALPLVFVSVAGLVQWILDYVPENRQRLVAWVVGSVIFIGTLPSIVSYLSDGTRFDYRPAFAAIQAEQEKTGVEQAVFAWPIIIARHYAPEFREHELLADRARLDSLLNQEREAWAVVSVKRYGIVHDDNGEMGLWLSENCRLVDTYQRPRLDYRLYRVDLWRCTAV